MLKIGALTLSDPGAGVGVGPGGVGVAVGGGGVGLTVGVGDGVGGNVGVGVGPPVVIVIKPLFCCGEGEFKSVSMNSKSFPGRTLQVSAVDAPGELLTRFQWITKRFPAPLSGVTPSLTNAATRRVFNVPGPVLRTFEPTVHPLAVRPDGATDAAAGLGTAMAESNTRSPWNPMKQVELLVQFPAPSTLGVMVVVMTGSS